ncbi:hypothetical protein RSSM_06173 [Rhodopirellula sallentina SM41]|uniref:Uncharacterized protein n=1 Tax=Rhodopirellula sallentina SM41 TaxID=1263870 RepID=M5U3E9_9BACT|nr:hypothetical protein RSSM_06173 [Rhodopirellula sallentina SM41]
MSAKAIENHLGRTRFGGCRQFEGSKASEMADVPRGWGYGSATPGFRSM